ncbi:MAG: hypothetical protein IKK19_05760 [Bacteroidales bacterium]|jgi:hypothetical protein|nr:hypothetical protein [Bacteroidales bacterium]MBR4088790.1 hypothetical protein [Bacteroidales bacterium]
MTTVLFLPEVVNQFLELAEILYDKGYLGFKDAAINYSEQLFKDIQTYLPLKVKKDAPSYFKRYGNDLFYSSFSRNKNTTWYVFYSIHEENGKTIFLVRYLGNNHIIAHHLLDDSEV